MKCDEKTVRKRRSLLGMVGTILFCVGVSLAMFKDHVFEAIVSHVLYLGPGSLLQQAWLQSPELPTNIYFFNWTNPQQLHNLNVKPTVEEVGPYVFKLNAVKKDIVWNDNDTVTFKTMRFWRNYEKRDNSNLTDTITIFNPVTMYASTYIKDWNFFLRGALSTLIDKGIVDGASVTKTVNELVMKGYDDTLVQLSNYVPFIASEVPRYNKFGFLKVLNGSENFGGALNMRRGTDGNFDLLTWNNKDVSPYYEGTCSKIRGSTGELYSYGSHWTNKSYLDVFLPELCRPLRFEFEEEVHVGGVLGYKYSVGKYALDNGTLYPENSCYCADRCLPSGIFNITTCRYNLPTFVSLPSFYLADPVYLSTVDGLKPNKEKHELYIILEPKTSIPLSVSIKIQFNVLVRQIDGISLFENVQEMMFPIVWMDQSGGPSAEEITKIKIILAFPCIQAALGCILGLVGIYLLIRSGELAALLVFVFKKCCTKKNLQLEEKPDAKIVFFSR